MKLEHTALKMTIAALASVNNGSPREGRGDVGVGAGKGTGNCKSGKDESNRDNFELHHIAFLILNTVTE